MGLIAHGRWLQALCLCLFFPVILASSTPISDTAISINKAHVAARRAQKGPACPADSEVARVESTGPRDLTCATRVSINHEGVVVNGHGNQMCRCMATYKCEGCPACTLNGRDIFSPGPGVASCKKDTPDPSPAPTPDPHSGRGSNTAGVIAGSLGSVALLGMAGGGYAFYRRHKAARTSANGENDPLFLRNALGSSHDTWAHHGSSAVNNLKPSNSSNGTRDTHFSGPFGVERGTLGQPRADSIIHTGRLYPSFSDAATNSTIDYDAMSDIPSSAGVSTTTYETAVTSQPANVTR